MGYGLLIIRYWRETGDWWLEAKNPEKRTSKNQENTFLEL
jgi:hypothetical protein